ncbi:MAG: 5-carboxymethyl-2-hydroxymuconate isomerase [Pseudomonas sp.]|uniref:5-carboxymethyl-2-hydroxymuconate Delta-isomerase n=1 Tax=Pseudomonas sp. TaxID=306 RepID=UPI0039828556
MPHCLIEGSLTLTRLIAPSELLALVEQAAAATQLFQPGEVKLRLSLYEHFSVGGTQEDFVHLIFYILAGRTDEQKRLLSRQVVRALVERLPSVNALSLDVRDIDREVFSNKRSCLLPD